MPLFPLSVERRVGLSLFLQTAILLSIVSVIYMNVRDLFDSVHWIQHTHEIIEKLDELNGGMADVQRGFRGFFIMGEESYLAPYHKGVQDIAVILPILDGMTKDHPRQRELYAGIPSRVDQFLNYYAHVVDLRRRYGPAKVRSMVKKGTGQKTMDAALGVIDQMETVEKRELAERQENQTFHTRNLLIAIMVMIFFVIIVAVASGWSLLRHVQNEKIANEKLKEKDRTLFQFLDGLPIGVFVVDPDGKTFYVNQVATELFGQGLVKGQGVQDISNRYYIYKENTDELYPADQLSIVRALRGERSEVEDAEIHQPNGNNILVKAVGSPIFSDKGEVTHGLVAFMDITEGKRMKMQLEKMAVQDELTGLYNRRGFLTLSGQHLKMAERRKDLVTLIFIDVDGLKKVNDELGHDMGDALIKEFGQLLAGHFRQTDIVARLGGDEFAILVTDSSNKNERVIDRLMEKVRLRNMKALLPFVLDFSAGLAVFDPAHPVSLNELIADADEKMYAQKLKKKRGGEQEV